MLLLFGLRLFKSILVSELLGTYPPLIQQYTTNNKFGLMSG